MKKYEEIHSKIRSLIDSGAFRPGERLPSLRALANREKVSLNTIKRAYATLMDEGMIDSSEKSGFFVSRTGMNGLVFPSKPKQVDLKTRCEKIKHVVDKIAASSVTNFFTVEASADLVPDRQLASLSGSLKVDWAKYPPLSGLMSLRAQVAKFYSHEHRALRPENIIITNGATEALTLALRTILKPRDRIVLEAPAYYGFFEHLEGSRVESIEVPVKPGYGLDTDILESVLEKGPVKALLCQPVVHNPTGLTYSPACVAKIARLARKHDFTVIQDGVFSDLLYQGDRPPNFSNIRGFEDFVYIGSFSKSVSPALRIGFLHAPKFQDIFETKKQSLTMATNVHAQRLMEKFLQSGRYQKHLKWFLKQIKTINAKTIGALPAGVSCVEPSGGYFLWLRLKGKENCNDVFRKMLESNIAVAPGDLFSSHREFERYLRINSGVLTNPSATEKLKILMGFLEG